MSEAEDFKTEMKRMDVANVAYTFLEGCASSSYAQKILDEILPEVAEDVGTAADPTDWNDDDVRLAIGRVLLARLGLDE